MSLQLPYIILSANVRTGPFDSRQDLRTFARKTVHSIVFFFILLCLLRSDDELLMSETPKELLHRRSTTTCMTLNDDFITWEGGLMTGTGVSRKEEPLLHPSLL